METKNQKLSSQALTISKTSKPQTFLTKSASQTQKMGRLFAGLLNKGDIVFLKGDLGAGKTTFVQGVVGAFGNKGLVQSSSFIVAKEYSAKNGLKLFHLDLYRLSGADIWDIDIEQYLYSGNIALVEWSERLAGADKIKTWDIKFSYVQGTNNREITFQKGQR
ncbi:MAG: tRNA (adenosine(37)-N6)-threonylcarbamoyltransferase complex ATPase subunit type 1 TsaE [Elusimicrobiota bacterium]|jgi:tRNA threonylcarbamoyladenosine biosynthesis protein TsaE|nr:tRNA (adenosine(37)-N6)-threonylcarbamoyltransferase complex ATPase subunit type 1 TsaE [Elusimicrobiota bacterium]